MRGSMKVVEMAIPGAYRIVPERFPDNRGSFTRRSGPASSPR
jgi:dTDP-4-dehydrorhamnose 3,5-epimerase-like enzyme